MHGNGTAPMLYKNPIESYIVVTIKDTLNTTVLSETAHEYLSGQTDNASFYNVQYEDVEIVSNIFTHLGTYTVTIDLYTQINDWTAWVKQDTWTITIQNEAAYTEPDQGDIGPGGSEVSAILVQGLGAAGLLMMAIGPLGAMWMWKHGSAVGALAFLTLMTMIGFAMARAFIGF
jgi:hypothetical protein